jgi:hypothetical protein
MKQTKLALIVLFGLTFSNAHSAEWTEGKAFPERAAVVKTVAQIKEQGKEPPASKTARQKSRREISELETHPYSLTNVKENDVPCTNGSSMCHPFLQVPKHLLNITVATYEDSGVIPPDAMGVVGPQQFILAANGRIRSFDKNSGKADNVLDISSNLFFSPIAEGFTSDPRIRYDRFSDRWFIVISAASMVPVRILLAVSDSGIVTPETKWSFFYFEPRPSDWSDYPSLGIDKHALYIGLNFLIKGNYVTSDAFVIPKAPLLAGTIKPFGFLNIVDPDPKKFEGPISPQGVDNYDADATEGYIIGIDGFPGRLMLRRIKDPGGKPAISGNIAIKVPNSKFPLPVPQKGSIASGQYFLQGFDKRLGNTHIRDKRLYTAHNIGLDNKGSVEAEKPTRNGCLWYEISMKDAEHPTVTQSGVLFQPSPDNDPSQRYFWMPGVMTNGLGSLVMACCTAGDQLYADAAYAMRFSSDPAGALRPAQIYTDSKVVYTLGFPPFKNLRWGEYTTASVDPMDNMTIWSISEFVVNPLSWGLQAIRVSAQPPAHISKVVPAEIEENQNNVKLTILGERVDGSAFYDPDDSYPNHLKVEIEDVKVNSMKWVSFTQIDLDVSTEFASEESKIIKVTNPDGQVIKTQGVLKIVPKKSA